jgi:hypothetical protein
MVLLAAVLIGAPAEARSLRDELGGASQTVGLLGGGAFDALAENIADTAARSLPVVSSSAGFTYRYNPATEVFERSSQTLGPLFLERPDTIGRGKFNLSVSVQYVQFDTFDGDDLRDLEAPDPIVVSVLDVAGNVLGFSAERLRYRLAIQNWVTALGATYGITDDLDVNLLLPIVASTLRVGVTAQQVAVAGPDGAFAPTTGPVRVGRTDGSDAGVGDVLLRLKYQLPRAGDLRSAAGVQLRLPSGDEDEFRGTGAFEMSPAIYVSTLVWSRVEPHANLAIDVRPEDVERSQARYGVGVDVDVTPRLNLNLAFLGRSEFADTADADETEFLHLTTAGVVPRPLLGIDFDRNDFFDLSFGLRAAVYGSIMVFANGIYALNDDGLRNDTIIPTFGVEGTF